MSHEDKKRMLHWQTVLGLIFRKIAENYEVPENYNVEKMRLFFPATGLIHE